ncbi:hypothetical protein ACWGI8_29125 [Streptomyces sp. NPDC054841]
MLSRSFPEERQRLARSYLRAARLVTRLWRKLHDDSLDVDD